MKYLWIPAVCLMMYCVYDSVNVNPDMTLISWLGMKFGVNYTHNMPLKLFTLAILGAWVFYVTSRSDDNAGPKSPGTSVG